MTHCKIKKGTFPARRSLPPWIKVRIPAGKQSEAVENILRQTKVRTVCRGAACPNTAECFHRGTATFMILGGVCTRACRFCAVRRGNLQPPEADEPQRVATAAAAMNLRHVVLTSVTRDDLDDGGARHFARVVTAVKKALPGATTEVLTPDFKGRSRDIFTVLESGPDVFNHNVETVRRLQRDVRPQADYQRSLHVLRLASGKRPRTLVKSGLMAGLGETDAEIRETMNDLHAAGCDLLTIGQYLAPSPEHIPVQRFVTPATFSLYAQWADAIGFRGTAAGPLVRSSFQAEKLYYRGAAKNSP